MSSRILRPPDIPHTLVYGKMKDRDISARNCSKPKPMAIPGNTAVIGKTKIISKNEPIIRSGINGENIMKRQDV